MKAIYVAGPYRADNHWLIEQNIHRARALGACIAQLGAVPLIPHANTAHWDGLCEDQFWLDAGLELLRRCDALALVKGWQRSSGTIAELKEAERLGLPVYNPECDDLTQWVEELKAGTRGPHQRRRDRRR
jgi:nucleoside 2-deoxyribosyltransferase